MTSYFRAARAAFACLALSITFTSAAPASSTTSTIRGERERVMIANVGSYIFGIDGRMIHPSPPMYDTPIEIAPGPHSLLIGFNASKYAMLPARLDAKAGAAYVARFEQTGQMRDEIVSTVWIEDEATHEIVVPKRQIWPEAQGATYVPPASGATASIHGTALSGGAGASFLGAVDGVLTADADHAKPLALATGPRALLISFSSDTIITNLPIVLDVKSSDRYVIGYEIKDRLVVNNGAPHFYFWVEDETTHERIVPSTEVPVRVLKYNVDVKPALGHKS